MWQSAGREWAPPSFELAHASYPRYEKPSGRYHLDGHFPERKLMNTNLVITAIGPDRPGIVSLLSSVGQKFGANWEGS